MGSQRKSASISTEDPFASNLAPEMEPRKVAKAYSHKQGPPSWMYMAMGIAFGMMMICLVYYVHSARQAAEISKHHRDTRRLFHDKRMGRDVDAQEHAEMLAKH